MNPFEQNPELLHKEPCSHCDPQGVTRAAAILAAFTARAALRKALAWFDTIGDGTQKEREEFREIFLHEVRDAIANCNSAIFHIAGPAPNKTSVAEFLGELKQGGEE